MPLGKRTDYGDAKFAGVEIPFSCDIVDTIQDHLQCGFDFIAAPLVHPRYRRSAPTRQPKGHTPPAFTRSDLLLTSSQWSGQVVGKVSAWIDPDSSVASLAADSCAALSQELGWAAHLGLQAVILPTPPQGIKSATYAQLINRSLAGLSHMAIWIRIPIGVEEEPRDGSDPPRNSLQDSQTARGNDPWEWWHQMRVLCESHSLLGVLLDVGPQLPHQALVERWRGEPVRALCVHTSCYTSNKRGYPVLPKRHQELLATFFQHSCQVILSGNSHHQIPGTAGADSVSKPAPENSSVHTLASSANGSVVSPQGCQHQLYPYWEYLCFLFRRMPAMPEQELLELRYRDYLQAPLQPLQDNLESQTYETFEKDVTKYVTYGEAVYRALLDRVPEEKVSTTTTLLMVVGAGRGPLVRASIKAAARAGRLLRVFAVEKNPNAVVTLQNLVVSEGWESQVTVISHDMRTWEAPEQADILVSELLGSFGDNELSPECLDGAQRFLKPTGISIPSSYTSFLAPVTTAKLYDSVKTYKDLEHLETPYVVKFHNHHLLAETQAVFAFHHPNHAEIIDNRRSKRMEFKRNPQDLGAVLHGFAGYFEAVLYKDVLLSTHPPTHTPNMFSWFPIYFPLQDPVYIPAGSTIVAHMWRCTSAHKVWYEWAVSQPVTTPIHNSSGRSYFVGL